MCVCVALSISKQRLSRQTSVRMLIIKHQASDLAIPVTSSSYRARGLIKEISSSKMAHLKHMYGNFIAPDRRLDILPPSEA